MPKITDLTEYRKKREGTALQYVHVDADGITWYQFGCSYFDDRGKEMTFAIWALDAEDAERRMSMIKRGATVYGQIFAEVSAD